MTRSFQLARWIRLTLAGWVLGIPIVILVSQLAEAAGIGSAQVWVGAGMGVGVGLMQQRALHGLLERPLQWLWPSTLGLALPFLITDLVPSIPYSVYACVVAGGLLTGLGQAWLLRFRLPRPYLWIVASTAGWICAAGGTALADRLQHFHLLRGIWGACIYLGTVASGGVLLALITGACLSQVHFEERQRRV
jgi:hypothetical protein